MSLRLVFMGTPQFACPTLSEIIGQGHEVVACYTREPAPAGRGMALTQSPVHAMAERFGIPVFTPKTLKGDEAAALFASRCLYRCKTRHRPQPSQYVQHARVGQPKRELK